MTGPFPPVIAFLVDFDRDILLHVYDDRGVDVTALDRATLLPLYRSRAEWLLDYDRRAWPRLSERWPDDRPPLPMAPIPRPFRYAREGGRTRR